MAQNTPSSTVSPATSTDPRIAAMSAILAQNWWAVAIRGVCCIIFGLVALFLPDATILTLVLFLSAYMVVDGIFGIVAGVRAASHHQRWGLLVLKGVLNIAVGIAFIWPGLTALTFVLLFGAWAIVTGVLEIVAALRLHPEYGRWWLILSGAASVIFGVLLVVVPLAGVIVVTWWIGAFALIFGIMLVVLAFRLRAHKDSGAPVGGSTAAAA